MLRVRARSIGAALSPVHTTGAAFWFVVAAVGMTWPLAAGLTRDIPWDFGDPLFVCWIIGWSAERVVMALSGNPSALIDLWNGNIFYPEPLTLAYSELLYAQVLQVLPLYAATRDLILSYNLLFISTFALSGLGTYLFVRELTGDWRAALIAGLVYGFAPNRASQAPHLHVLSSQWMPFALYGFRRYLDTGRRRALAGATAAVVLQNWSCGYYMLFFALLLPAYLLWELSARGRLLDRRAWRGILASAFVVALLAVPVTWPYLALRSLHPTFKRSTNEIEYYSADVYAYLTASPHLRVWGDLRTFVRPEGELFPGSAALVLSLVGIGAAAVGLRRRRAADRSSPDVPARPSGARRLVGWCGLTAAAASAVALGWVVATGGQLPEDRLERARRQVLLQQQVDRATRLAAAEYAPGRFRSVMEGFPWDKFDPLHPQRGIKMVCARVFEHIDPSTGDAMDRAVDGLRAVGVEVERDGIDRLRFSDGSLVDVLRNAEFAAGVPGATITWTWLVVEHEPLVVAPWLLLALCAGLLLALASVRRWRLSATAMLRSPAGFFLLVALGAAWLSLGPVAHSRGVAIRGFGIYGLLVGSLPGFDGIRVVARIAMLTFLALAVLAGLGSHAILRRWPRAASAFTALAIVWVLADGFVAPVPRNQNWTDEGLAYPPPREVSFKDAPDVYRFLRDLPERAALVEFPYGVIPWEIRHIYHSTFHWRPLVNGFSGWAPASRLQLDALRTPLTDPAATWATLVRSGATHVVIHRDAYPAPPAARALEAEHLSAVLEEHGSRRVADFADAVVFALPVSGS